MIRANLYWEHSGKALSFDQRKVVFEQCNEADVTKRDRMRKRCDPLLCLFGGSDLMCTDNSDVKNGIANGTTAKFRKAWLKPGSKLTPIKLFGHWVNSVDIRDVDHLELEWHDCFYKGRFKVHPEKGTFNVKFPIVEFGRKMTVDAGMKLTYFPVLSNHATTGHKLQGKSLDELVIAQWSSVQNWAYVVLSRVRTLEGLFLTEPIPSNVDFTPPHEYLAMMIRLRDSISAVPGQVTDLAERFAVTNMELN